MHNRKSDGLLHYGRKSSKEDPKISRERQRLAVEAWTKVHDVELVGEVYEAGVSGSKTWQDRELGQAIEACKRGEAGGIIVEEQSRLSRENGLKTSEVWQAFQDAGIRLVCVADGIDTSTGDHEFLFAVKAAMHREQWKAYARRVDDAKRNAVIGRGVHISAKVPAGYVRRGRGLPLELDAKTAPAITRAFELRASGASKPEVAALLDELVPGGPSGGGRWTVETVNSVLRNRVYLGEARAGKKYVRPDAHPAIVDRATFDTVQALWARPEPRALPGSTAALLAGAIARCKSCGYALVKSSSGGGGGATYKCRRHSAAGVCSAPASISAAVLEAFVEDACRERVRSKRIERVAASGVDVDEVHRRLAGLREQRLLFESGEYAVQLGAEAALRGLRGVDERIAEAELELERTVPASGSPFELVKAGDVWPESVADRRELIASGVDAVIVSRAPRGTPAAGRVEILFRGDVGSRPRRPLHGRPEVEAGLAAA
jgi:DNA invertase Pin-like site-specific DNA recombinase